MAHRLDREDESTAAWTLVGRFKAQNGVFDYFMVTIAGTTHSGINFSAWTQRFLGCLAVEGYKDGWADKRPNGDKEKASDYRNDNFTKLGKILATTSLINPDYNIWDDYGVQPSGCRCSTTVCTIRNIPKRLIELQCRWCSDIERMEFAWCRGL